MQPYLINPVRRCRKMRKNPIRKSALSKIMAKASALRKKGLSAKASLKEAWKNKGTRRTNTMAKHRKSHRKHRNNPMSSLLMLNPRRGHGRRHYRSNPFNIGGMMPLAMKAVWVAVGYTGGTILTDLASSKVAMLSTPMGKIGARVGIAALSGYAVKRFVGKEQAALVVAGVLAPIVVDGINMVKEQFLPATTVKLGMIDTRSAIRRGVGAYAPLNLGAYAPMDRASLHC